MSKRKNSCLRSIGLITAFSLAIAAGAPAAVQAQPAANRETGVSPARPAAIAPHDGPVIQVALLLDTSNSMDGLIDQAKAALWAIVNDLTLARDEHGVAPQLQIALYEYGNDTIPASLGFVRQRTPFTTDLDLLSEQLFSLRTDGGSEFCGKVIHTAVNQLDWWLGEGESHAEQNDADPEAKPLDEAAIDAVRSGIERRGDPVVRLGPVRRVDSKVVRMMVIAGNEPFTQGSTAYQEAIASARALGVKVSTIFCGDRESGINTKWEHGARLGGGLYAHIDQNESAVEPPTPFDAEISRLNRELNTTYLAYNTAPAREGYMRQEAQTAQNDEAGLSAVNARAKAGANYINSHWDIVDAVKRDNVALGEIPADELPEELASLSADQREARIDQLWNKRLAIQSKINEQARQRAEFVCKHFEINGAERFDQAIVRGIREQASEAGLNFVAPDEPSAHVDPDGP